MVYLRMQYISFNGKLYPENASVTQVSNRGFRYGDGLFETMKMLDGNLLQQALHFKRLFAGMQVLQFEPPKHFTEENLVMAVKKLAKKNGHENGARVRLTLFRGNGGLYDAISHAPDYIIETWGLPNEAGQWNSNGLIAGIYTEVKKSCDILCNLKHNNFLPYVLAALKAKKEKWNDALVLNQYGRVADATIANIFVVKNGEIFTPALAEGCVAGVMRHELIIFFQRENFIIHEMQMTTDFVLDADEVFFTNSIYTMRWVQCIDDSYYSNAFTQKIFALFWPTIC